MRLVLVLAVAGLVAVPFAAASATVSQTSADCRIVPGLVRACTLVLRHSVTPTACDATACTLVHECVAELTGVMAQASGACGDEPWSVATATGTASVARNDGGLRAPIGFCTTFTMTGSAHAPVLSPQPPGTPMGTGAVVNDIVACAT